MLLGVINGKPEVFMSFDEFYRVTWSPEKEYSFVTDFSVKGKTYAARKSYARELAIDVSNAVSKGKLTWSEIADIAQELELIGKRCGLLKEFKENGII